MIRIVLIHVLSNQNIELYFLDYYKFWLRSIDSVSDINTPVIVIGTHAENKSEQVRKE